MTPLETGLLLDAMNGVVLEGGHRPVATAATDVENEVAVEFGSVRRMDDFGVELHGKELAAFVADGGKWRPVRRSDDPEAVRQSRDPVAMAHPHLMAFALCPDAVEQRAVITNLEKGASELSVVRRLDAAAELVTHHLFAIADTENRQPESKDLVRRARALALQDAGRSARQDNASQSVPIQRGLCRLKGHDLGIHAGLADPPRNELGHLGAEVDDENLVRHGI